MGSAARLIQSNELQQQLDTPRLRLLDCRFSLQAPELGRSEWLAGHIPGAVYADLDKDLAAPVTRTTGRHPLPEPDVFAATLGRLGIDNDSSVVVYDGGSGAIAARAWWMLRWLGHDDVALLDGGFAAWGAASGPIESGEVVIKKAAFHGTPNPQRVLTTLELTELLKQPGTLLLVDARDAARFDGELEPIDSVAGHIPGALNFPLNRSLHDTGLWLEPSVLRQRWQELLGPDLTVPWSVMCGSGVTACHLAFSGLRAGYSEPRLYAGSWSEWIRDPRRPVVRARTAHKQAGPGA
ncbi:MAG TPA: sulfurtransferase [Woeseiaceae bacterium]|nr:sulfurtransferase [Woeseiaceae bacterium]